MNDLSGASALYRECLLLRREGSERSGAVTCLEGLGAVARGQGQPERAARLFAAAAALRAALGLPLWPDERPEHDAHLAALRAALGEDVLTAAWETGHALPWEKAVAEALEDAGPLTNC